MSEHKPYHSLGEDICTECKGYEPWPCRDFLQAALAAAEARAAAAEQRVAQLERGEIEAIVAAAFSWKAALDNANAALASEEDGWVDRMHSTHREFQKAAENLEAALMVLAAARNE